MFPRVYRKDLAAASLRQFLFDLLKESGFFGIERDFRKIASPCDDEWNFALEFRIELHAVQCPQSIRVVWIQQERVEHGAQHRTVALVFLQSLPNVFFQPG